MQEYKCQICGRPATMHYVETINGITKETHYCGKCAKSSKVNVYDPFEALYGTSNILNSIFGTQAVKREVVCECGMTERELLGGCKFGCAKCYSTFEHVAKRLVDNLGGGEYVGEAPMPLKPQDMKVATEQTAKPASEIDSLLQDLDVAIKEERYADCDKLKKKIDKLRQDKKKEG